MQYRSKCGGAQAYRVTPGPRAVQRMRWWMPSCLKVFTVIGFILISGTGHGVARAADPPTLEDLQLELQRRLSTVPQGRSGASAPNGSTPGKRQSGAESTVLSVHSDAACMFSINGRPLAALHADESREFSIPSGTALVECLSFAETDAKFRKAFKFDPGA